MGSAPASLADNPFLITLLLEMQTTIFLRTEMSRKTEYVHNPCFLSANILKILGVFAENQKKNIISEIINESTFGWSAEDVLLNVFGLPTSRNYYLSQVLSKGLELLADHSRPNSELNAVRRQIEEYFPLMKDNDPLKSIAEIIINTTLR